MSSVARGVCLFALLVISPCMVASRAFAQSCTADLVIINAKVHTVDLARPSAEAVAICGERIARVGTNDDARRLAGERTRTIDAKGRLLIPGFNDAHVHLVSGAEELVGVDLRPARDERDFTHRIGTYVAGLP